MGFLDRLKQAADAVQQQMAQRQGQDEPWQQGQDQSSQPPQPGSWQPQGGDPGNDPLTTPVPPGPPFPPSQPLPQAFRLERAINGSVGMAGATWRRWPTQVMRGAYPHLGAERFEGVLTIPPGTAAPGALELRMILDPFRPDGGYRTRSFANSVVLREEASGRTWRADRFKSLGLIVVNPDGVSGSFRRFYLRSPERPSDRSAFVILDGDWRIAA